MLNHFTNLTRMAKCQELGEPIHVYAFVLLHRVGQPVEYFLISGRELVAKETQIWGTGGGRIKMAGITMGGIKPYKDNWAVFEDDFAQQTPGGDSSTRADAGLGTPQE